MTTMTGTVEDVDGNVWEPTKAVPTLWETVT